MRAMRVLTGLAVVLALAATGCAHKCGGQCYSAKSLPYPATTAKPHSSPSLANRPSNQVPAAPKIPAAPKLDAN